ALFLWQARGFRWPLGIVETKHAACHLGADVAFFAPCPMSFTFQDTVSYLRRRLQEPLPGPVAQGRLAPSHRDELQRLYAPGRPCREAAVLVLLFPLQGASAVVLTVRHAGLKQHAGQISFPGGRREPDESLEATALREAFEE